MSSSILWRIVEYSLHVGLLRPDGWLKLRIRTSRGGRAGETDIRLNVAGALRYVLQQVTAGYVFTEQEQAYDGDDV